MTFDAQRTRLSDTVEGAPRRWRVEVVWWEGVEVCVRVCVRVPAIRRGPVAMLRGGCDICGLGEIMVVGLVLKVVARIDEGGKGAAMMIRKGGGEDTGDEESWTIWRNWSLGGGGRSYSLLRKLFYQVLRREIGSRR